MKKSLLSFLTILSTATASALTVGTATKVEVAGTGHNPMLSPDGRTMLFSADDHTGLKAIDLSTNRVTVLDEASGAGFAPVFSADGSKVVYRTAELVDGLMHRDVRAYDFTAAKSTKIQGLNRTDVDLHATAGKEKYVFGDIKRIVHVENGKTQYLTPIADAHSYLWVSLSPDGTKILFSEPFKGVFVADADGKNAIRIAAKGDYPAWAGQNIVTFTVSHDDGYVILDSTLKVYDLTTGVTVDLTDKDVLVGESTSAADGTVVYSTLGGEIYKLTVK